MAKYRIMSQIVVPSVDLKRAGKSDTLVTYLNLDKNSTGYCRIPSESPTIDEISAAIKAKESAPGNHTGKEITI